jgi:hypothetical protein
VVAVEDAAVDYSVKYLLRVQLHRLGHLVDPLSGEGPFSVYEEHFAFEAAVLDG